MREETTKYRGGGEDDQFKKMCQNFINRGYQQQNKLELLGDDDSVRTAQVCLTAYH